MITCKVGENIINCYDGTHNKEQLKKWSIKNILICPVCNTPYEYCHGEFKSPYFRHKDKCECENLYSEPESEEHINGKRDLFEWIKIQKGVTEAILEGWLPDTKQRPDIMFKYNNIQHVIEYQCSPLATEYLERHELYSIAGIKDIWILGTNKYIEKSENNKKFNKKVIETYTNYYYDSEYKIFMFDDIENQITNDNYINTIITREYSVSQLYHNQQSRSLILQKSLIRTSELFMLSINSVEFYESEIQINKSIKELIKDKYSKIIEEQKELNSKKDVCNCLITDIITLFDKKYSLNIMKMPSVPYGFKCNNHYYQLDNFFSYPCMYFCEIKYWMQHKRNRTIFSINMQENPIDMIEKYLVDNLVKEVTNAKQTILY